MNQKAYCSCHNLTHQDFQTACMAGADNIRQCFQYLNCKPKCAECIPWVKTILQDKADPSRLMNIQAID